MSEPADTIVAIATGAGVGGVGVVRVSGPAALDIAQRLSGIGPQPRYAHLAQFTDALGRVIDQGLLLYFPAPRSFTGEHVVELHAHGGPTLLAMLVARCCELGARPARPGEFSERAFLNGKLDLVQAEAIADLIEAETAAAVRAAQRSLEGEFSRRVQTLLTSLTELRVHVESAIDFPEEEIDFLSDSAISDGLRAVRENWEDVRAGARQGRLLRDGLQIALIGRPNAGKSSLLNALAQTEAAIVTEVPGTTRDLLREHVQIDGIPVHLVDTAGLRETDDIVEQEGVRRARAALAEADHVLVIVDAVSGEVPSFDIPDGVSVTEVWNKIDLSGDAPSDSGERSERLYVSAKTGAGIAALRTHIAATAGAARGTGSFSARQRHLDALDRVGDHLKAAAQQLDAGQGELVAEELRLAQGELGAITGEFSSDDLLGEIFSSFCIGK